MTVATINFGKYDGKTYQEMLKLDPGYLQWAHENVHGFFLSLEQQCEVENAIIAAQEAIDVVRDSFWDGQGDD